MSSEQADRFAEQFVAAVIARRDAYRAGDVPLHNRWWKKGDKAAQALIQCGQEGKDALEELMTHAVPIVRESATGYVLKWAPSKAVPVLEDLLLWAKQDPTTGFTEPFQVLRNAKGLLAQHYGINVLDVYDHVLSRRGDAVIQR